MHLDYYKEWHTTRSITFLQWQKRTVPEPYYEPECLYPRACPAIKIMTNIIGTS